MHCTVRNLFLQKCLGIKIPLGLFIHTLSYYQCMLLRFCSYLYYLIPTQVDTSERFLFPAIVQEVSSILEENFSDTGSMELVQCEVTPLPSHAKLIRKKSGNLMVLPLPRLRKLMSEETPV